MRVFNSRKCLKTIIKKIREGPKSSTQKLGHCKIKPACLCKIYIALSNTHDFHSALAQCTGTRMSVGHQPGRIERKIHEEVSNQIWLYRMIFYSFSVKEIWHVAFSRMAHSIHYSFPLGEHKKFKKPLLFPDVKQVSVPILPHFSLDEMSKWCN